MPFERDISLGPGKIPLGGNHRKSGRRRGKVSDLVPSIAVKISLQLPSAVLCHPVYAKAALFARPPVTPVLTVGCLESGTVECTEIAPVGDPVGRLASVAYLSESPFGGAPSRLHRSTLHLAGGLGND